MLLSIIIPMYNVAQYLENCIENIKIKNIEYEILMINDGSPDNSLDIAKRIALKNTHVRVLSQENKGLGGARNLGIKNAKGKYLLFLDADDILIMQDFSFLDNENADIIEFSSKNINPNGKVISKFIANNSINLSDGISYYKNNPSMFSVCNKIYSTSFFKFNNLYFKEHVYIEDFEFNTKAFLLTNSIKSSSDVIQHFVQMPNSITRNSDKSRKIKLVNDMIIVARSIDSFASKIGKSDLQFIKTRLTWLTIDVIYHSLKNNLGYKFLEDRLNDLKNNNLYQLDFEVNNRNKEIFRRLLKLPFGLTLVKFYSKRMYEK